MELVSTKKLSSILEKYKYAFLIVLIGIVLMLMPTSRQEPSKTKSEENPQTSSLQEQLEQILSYIDGAGEVRVLLTEKNGWSNIYQTDIDSDTDANGTSEQIRTVIVTSSERNEEGLILRKDPPVYMGAVIVCEGASSPQIRLAIMEAVSCATGLNSHQISIVKME